MDVNFRLFTWEDAPALITLANAAADADQVDERYNADLLREELEAHNDPTQDCWLALLPDGSLAGYAYVEWKDEDHALWGFGWGMIHPDKRRQGIGRQLIRHVDAHFAAKVRSTPDGKTAYIQRFINSRNAGETALALSEGYAPLRSSYRMSMSLEKPLAPAQMPEGFELRPFVPEHDTRAVHELDNTAFMDGGGREHPVSYEDWYHYSIETRFDPALWLVAYAGDQPVGVAFSQRFDEIQSDLAWVAGLAVLRPWRGRGLGEVLLRQSFYICQQAGFKRVGLGVRAENDTAVNLYRRAGMEIYTKYTHYRKVVR